MTKIDFISVISLGYILLATTVGLIFYLRSKSRAKALPGITAIGTGISLFASQIMSYVVEGSRFGLVTAVLVNLAISVFGGVMAGYSASVLLRRQKKVQ